VIVHFVDIGGVEDHYCLNFLFIIVSFLDFLTLHVRLVNQIKSLYLVHLINTVRPV